MSLGVRSGKWLNRRAWTSEEDETLKRLFAEAITDKEIAEKMGRSEDSVFMRRHHFGLKRYRMQLGPVPDDFAEVAPGRSVLWLREYYNCGYKSIRAWREQCGIKVANAPKPKPMRVAVARKEAAPQARVKRGNFKLPGPPVMRAELDQSLASLAAQHLRRIGFTNVYRATVLPAAARAHLDDFGKHHYAVAGRGFMHESELIALAEARGFQRWAA